MLNLQTYKTCFFDSSICGYPPQGFFGVVIQRLTRKMVKQVILPGRKMIGSLWNFS
jgi:hypothetical protein